MAEEEDFHENEDMQKLDGEEVWSKKHKENAYNADRKKAMPEEEVGAVAVQPYLIHIHLLLVIGLGQHQSDAHKLQFEMKNQDSRGQKQMFHEKHHFHDFLYHCCLSLLAMPADHGNWCQNCCLLHKVQALEEAVQQGSWSH